MNWEAMGAIGEIFGAIAVFATLVYLSIQIKQSSNMMRANIKEQRAAATQVQLQRMIDLADIFSKTASGEEPSPTEMFQLRVHFRGIMRNYDTYFRQYSFGLFDEVEWKAIRKMIQNNFIPPTSNSIASKWMKTEWEAIRSEFPEDFQNFIEALQK